MSASPSPRALPIGSDDLYLFNEGTHRRLATCLGCQPFDDGQGASFAVWAPNAARVEVVGDFNGWRTGGALAPLGSSGIFAGIVDAARPGDVYKYAVTEKSGQRRERADPIAIRTEVPPRTGSVVWRLDYDWHDAPWLQQRKLRRSRREPVSIYEMHLGSWRRDPARPDELLSYAELAAPLIRHLEDGGFTHVEFLPVMEHPFYGSWGYQVTSYFAPSARYGTPEQLMGLIDELHGAGIGVILDWAPAHFPADEFALARFDGTALYEHDDPRRGRHPDWDSLVFNYGRNEVRSFLLSSAEHWLERYHADALRVDAVASMLYLDYSRRPGEWIPNVYGGREDLDAVEFLRQLTDAVADSHPDVDVIAEESTAWPGVSRAVAEGGLGFDFKWDMGWMHDTLEYIQHDPVHRHYHHDDLTRRGLWAFGEAYVLPLSHDEVTHGKSSLLSKMPGDGWQQFANLRLLIGYQFTQPGKKLLFMGSEFGQWNEWDHDRSLDWHLLGFERHAAVFAWVADCNALYRREAALFELDDDPAAYRVVEADGAASIFAFERWSSSGELIVVACNFTPVPRDRYPLFVSRPGLFAELLNSDAVEYGGSGLGNLGRVEASATVDGRGELRLTVPPLACVVLRHVDA